MSRYILFRRIFKTVIVIIKGICADIKEVFSVINGIVYLGRTNLRQKVFMVSSQATVNLRFFGLAAFMQISETQNPQILAGYFPIACGILVTYILLLLILQGLIFFGYINNTILLEFILRKKYLKQICMNYCYFVLYTKSTFEQQPFALSFGLCLPPIASICDNILQMGSIWGRPWNLIAFYFTLSLTLLTFDSLSIKICKELFDNPTSCFSKAFKEFLNTKATLIPPLKAGFWTKLGTLTATGQAAFYAGAFACVTAVATTGLNVYSSERRDIRQAAKEDANRQAQAAKEAADRQAQAVKEAADRQAQAAKEAADRQAERDRQILKYRERQQQREHERAKWAEEEKAKRCWWQR